MIYLILKILGYLLLSLLLGFGAGWLVRNISSMSREEKMRRSIAEARARVPKLESQLGSRDEQILKLNNEHGRKVQRISELVEQLKSAEQALRDKDAVARHAVARQGETPDAEPKGREEASGRVVAGLKADILRLEQELGDTRRAGAQVVDDSVAAAAVLRRLRSLHADAGTDVVAQQEIGETLAQEVEGVVAQWQRTADELNRLNRNFETEQRKVAELERERELQVKSLQVLHQQLALQREQGSQSAAG